MEKARFLSTPPFDARAYFGQSPVVNAWPQLPLAKSRPTPINGRRYEEQPLPQRLIWGGPVFRKERDL
eukprot:2777587-Lingulodinium_polyedra.AAC.1